MGKNKFALKYFSGKIKCFKAMLVFFFFNGKSGHRGPTQPAYWKDPPRPSNHHRTFPDTQTPSETLLSDPPTRKSIHKRSSKILTYALRPSQTLLTSRSRHSKSLSHHPCKSFTLQKGYKRSKYSRIFQDHQDPPIFIILYLYPPRAYHTIQGVRFYIENFHRCYQLLINLEPFRTLHTI